MVVVEVVALVLIVACCFFSVREIARGISSDLAFRRAYLLALDHLKWLSEQADKAAEIQRLEDPLRRRGAP